MSNFIKVATPFVMPSGAAKPSTTSSNGSVGVTPNNSNGNNTGHSSSVSQQQAKYPEETNAIHGMQQQLASLSQRMVTKYRNLADPATKEKRQLIDQFGLTQIGRELQSNDDGVWGPNTTKALKAVQLYIDKYLADVGLETLVPGPYKLSSGAKQLIIDAVNRNIKIVGDLLAAESLENSSDGENAGELLDCLNTTKEDIENAQQDGPTKITVHYIQNRVLPFIKKQFKINKISSWFIWTFGINFLWST